MSNIEEKKKKKSELGWWQRFSADPEAQKDFFNNAMGSSDASSGETSGEAVGMGENLEENSNNYRRVRNALFGDPKGRIKTFAIISAENPLGWKDATEEEYLNKYRAWLNNPREYNKTAREGIKSDVLKDRVIKTGDDTLKHGHFTYAEIKGFYGEHEKTLMIFNIPLSDAKIIAGNYGQESFFWGKTEGDKSKIGYYFHTTPSCREYKLVEVSDTITLEDDATEFFSKYGIKFRINMGEFGDTIVTPEYDDDFDESMDDNRTFMSRAHYRHKYAEEMHNYEAFRACDNRPIMESSTSRIFQHLTTDDTWAIVSPYRSERSEKENLAKMTELKADARKYGFIQFVSRWVENGEAFDERSLLIPNIKVEDAIALGKKYDQSSVIVKDESGCREICTTPFETFGVGDVVRTYNINGNKIMNISDAEEIFSKRCGGPASKPIKGGKAFHLSEVYEVEEPRPSYFHNEERLTLVLECKDESDALTESSLSKLYDYIQSSDVGFVTAFKSPRWIKDHYEVGEGANTPREIHKINRSRNKALVADLRTLGYSFFKVDGSYENQGRKDAGLSNYTDKEESFAVIDRHHNKDFVENIHLLGNKYIQESVLIIYAGGKKAEFIYADGSREDAGVPTFGKDSPFKSLINGRPFVLESISDLVEPRIRSSAQRTDVLSNFEAMRALESPRNTAEIDE